MTGTFQRLYQATPFDPTDRQDQIGGLIPDDMLVREFPANG